MIRILLLLMIGEMAAGGMVQMLLEKVRQTGIYARQLVRRQLNAPYALQVGVRSQIIVAI